MKREQRKAELKRARRERSQRVTRESTPVLPRTVVLQPPEEPQPSSMIDQLGAYMRQLGVYPVLDLSRPLKEVEVIETPRLENQT